MIRGNRHSPKEALQHSPLQWYLKRMVSLRSQDPEVAFFLSTDSPDVSAMVHARFDGVIEQQPKSPYNSREGVADAVVDLYCLAGTTYILGAHYSSFSKTAGCSPIMGPTRHPGCRPRLRGVNGAGRDLAGDLTPWLPIG